MLLLQNFLLRSYQEAKGVSQRNMLSYFWYHLSAFNFLSICMRRREESRIQHLKHLLDYLPVILANTRFFPSCHQPVFCQVIKDPNRQTFFSGRLISHCCKGLFHAQPKQFFSRPSMQFYQIVTPKLLSFLGI